MIVKWFATAVSMALGNIFIASLVKSIRKVAVLGNLEVIKRRIKLNFVKCPFKKENIFL